MLDHVSFGTNDIDRAHAFYAPLMSLVGLHLIKKDKTGAHYGVSEILFSLVRPVNGKPATPGNGAHVCFRVRDRETVNQFHALALKNGGTSDSVPKIWPEYDVNYYSAFAYDLDGNKIEAVCYSAK